jgi:hypothetical protein
MNAKPLLHLENKHLSLNLNDDCSCDILVKKTGTRWRMNNVAMQDYSEIHEDTLWVRTERGYCDYFPGRFHAVKAGDALRVSVLQAPLCNPRGEFTLYVELQGAEIVFRMEDISEALQSLTFPPHLHSESVILPDDVGRWVRKNEPKWECRFLMQNSGLNMRWTGGLKADERNGWIAIIDDGFADSGFYTNSCAIAPCWLKSMGQWDKTRAVRYAFSDKGYVGLAKIFRAYARRTGLFQSLEEKIEKLPTLGNLLGGRIVSFYQSRTVHRALYEEMLWPLPPNIDEMNGKVEVRLTHAEVAEVIRDMKVLGMQRGLFALRGTFNGGYDNSHPDIWPPEPALGTVDELAAIMAQPEPYMVSLHDNYQDVYPHTKDFPRGVVVTRKGELLSGGPWDGGRCFIMNPRESIRNAERNWRDLAPLNPRAHFIDTASCVQFYQDFHPDHRMTRTQDVEAKQDLMRFFRERVVVLGSENAADFGAAFLDYLENRHVQKPGVSIPLWPLVFHDSAFCARYGTGGTAGGKPVRALENRLWGYMKYWPVNNLAEWRMQREAFQATLPEDEWHKKTGLAEMTNHRYLTEDGQVEQTEFSSGHSVIVNFANESRTVEGRTVPAQGFLEMN